MENVIQFPTRPVRDWLTIERSMNDALTKIGASEDVQQRLLSAMKKFFQETLDFKFDLSTSAAFPNTLSAEERSDICAEIGRNIGESSSKQLQSFTNALFFERLHYEIEICRELGIL